MKDVDNFRLTETVTVSKVKIWMLKKDEESKVELISLIHHRFYNRYIKHIKPANSGFLKMSVACFMIEALESFKQGIENTTGKSGRMFDDFFSSEEFNFPGFKGVSGDFFRHIRCGILHQGETTNAWRILRKNALLNTSDKTINATKFVESLEKSLDDYIERLRSSGFESEIWKNAFKKLQDIIKNCKERD